MSAQRMLKVLTIGFAACVLIAGAFIANESPLHDQAIASQEVTATTAR